MDLSARISALATTAGLQGCLVLNEADSEPQGWLTLDGKHTPLLDIPEGYLVAGPKESTLMQQHQMLMTGELPQGLTVDDAWKIAAAVSNFNWQRTKKEPAVLVSLPRLPAGMAKAPNRGPVFPFRRDLTAAVVSEGAVDVLMTAVAHRTDLTQEQFTSDVSMYIGRRYEPGDAVNPWEVVRGLPGTGVIVWKLPDQVFRWALTQAQTRLERDGVGSNHPNHPNHPQRQRG